MNFRDKKVWVSVLGSLIFGASAVSALSQHFSWNIGFLPDFLGNEFTMKVFLLLAGLILLYDSFYLKSLRGHIKISAVSAGVILAFLGMFPLLNQFGMLNFLPFIVEFTLSPLILAGVLLFYSFYLLWDSYLLIM